MKITDIKQQAKRQDRYSIFIDEKYAFALSEPELLSTGLKVGRELDSSELEKLRQTAVIDKGIYRVLELVSRRPRSRWEIEDYLKRKKYDREEVDKITRAINAKGYIDDEDFARRWVDSRRLLKPVSTRKLRLELKQKKISEDIVQKVLDEDKTDEKEVLRELIDKKLRQSKYADEQKLIAYLARQGFNYSDIKDVLSD